MTEPQQPKAAPKPTNTIDNSLEDLINEFRCDDHRCSKVEQLNKDCAAAINKTIMEARINQCERLDPYIDPEFRELYEQELDGLTKKYGRADNE